MPICLAEVEEAKRLNANTIDTAHILLALLKEDASIRYPLKPHTRSIDLGEGQKQRPRTTGFTLNGGLCVEYPPNHLILGW